MNREILGIEKQRLERVIAGYESAVALDLEQMAAAAGFAPVRTRVSIEKDPGQRGIWDGDGNIYGSKAQGAG